MSDVYGIAVREIEDVLLLLQQHLGLLFRQVAEQKWQSLETSDEQFTLQVHDAEAEAVYATADYPIWFQVEQTTRAAEIETLLYQHLADDVALLQRGQLAVGLRGTSQQMVDVGRTARIMGSGALDVLATPALVALAEAAAMNALQGRLPEGKTSVGTAIEIKHIAATPPGVAVRAEAVITSLRKRGVRFRVQAWDVYEIIGEGTHQRRIVDMANFMVRVGGKIQH
ncbi:MAG: thioesterase family protein [Anaerolineales bacterium]